MGGCVLVPPNVSTPAKCSSAATREERVGSWRSFSQGKQKKKKQKVAILG